MAEKLKTAHEKYKEQINYMIFGLLTTVVNMAAYYLLMFFPWFASDEKVTLFSENFTVGYLAANLIAYVIAVIFSYAANRHFVFQHKVTGKKAVVRQFCVFLATRIAALLVEEFLLFAAVEHFDIGKYVAKWPVAMLMVIVNYPLGKLIVFRDPNKKKGAKAD